MPGYLTIDTMNTNRPDPDALLDKIQREDQKQQRGRLKIFFGACAGVGKTYAMLNAAHAQKANGVDVLVGGAGLFLEQGRCRQNLTALAVTTLRHLVVYPSLLQGMQFVTLGQAFDGGHALVGRG